MEAWQTEQRVRLRGHADAEKGVFGLVVDLGLPVVHFVLFWHWQVAHDCAFGVEELDLGTGLDKAVGNLQLGLKLPGRDALFLDGEILRKGNVGLDGFWRVRCDKSCIEC